MKQAVAGLSATGLALGLAIVVSLAPLHARAATWGVLIGVSKYGNSQVASLNFPAVDATELKRSLTEKGKIPADNIKLLVDDEATGENIKAAFSDFLAKNVKPGDDVIVSMAGHGVCKGVGLDAKSYFLPTDVRGLSAAAMEQSAINVRTISTELSKLPAKQFVILVDACREDPTPGRGLKGNQLSDKMSSDFQVVPQNAVASTASATFFACQIGERAYEDAAFKHGVFTYYVLDAIEKATSMGQRQGELKMDVLAGYVSDNVQQWAKAKNGEGAEIEQQPQLQVLGETPKVVLMKVKSSDTVLPSTTKPVIVGEALKKIDTRSAGGPAADAYQKAQAAERNDMPDVAEQGYAVVIDSDPNFGPAYDRLARLYTRRGSTSRAIETLLKRNKTIAPDAHAYSELALTYTAVARKMAMAEPPAGGDTKPEKRNDVKIGGIKLPGGLFGGKKKKPEPPAEKPEEKPAAGADAGEFRATESRGQAAAFALKAAKLAEESDPKSSEAKQAMGFALIATDSKGANREAAIDIFGRAVFLDGKDPAATYGLGYALRYFSTFEKGDAQLAMLKRSADALKAALALSPNYYEAHRELAYCYHMMGDKPAATKEYETANANRSGASDMNEVAGLNVSLSSLFREAANTANGSRKQGLMDASAGYLSEAKDISPDIKQVLQLLLYHGPGGVIQGGLDRTLRAPFNEAAGAVGRFGISVPGIRFP